MLESNNNKTIMSPNMDIVQRLAELNRWQEEQKRLLEERQNLQRQRLGLEQRTMYEMLGLMPGDLALGDVDIEQLTESDQTDAAAKMIVHQQDDDAYTAENRQNDEDEHSISEPTVMTNTQRSSGYGSEAHPPLVCETVSTKPKRKFLKRGEGLKQRFKINPDELRITNLPRYKFANAHPQYKTPKQAKRGILKQKSKPEPEKVKPATERPNGQLTPDKHEKRFQQQLFKSHTVCNSTPDLKSSCASSTTATTSPKVRFVDLPPATLPSPRQKQLSTDDEGSTTSTTVSTMQGVTWAKVLDTQHIKPVQVRLTTAHVEDDENISIFELLEQKAQEGNIDMNSSCIRAFMARKQRQRPDDSDVIPVSERLKEMHLSPQVQELIDEDDADQESTIVNEQTDTPTDSNYNTPIRMGRAQVHVRFSDSNDTHEYVEETTSEGSTLPAEDSVDNAALFQQFKTALFHALDQRKAQVEATQQKQNESDELSSLLQEKADLVKQRLSELETEIAMFKENNMQLLRMKQQHELEKANYAHEHGEAMERLHDEKMQFEIYMHDERIKLDEDRRKFEQQMRMQKSNANSKDKKEIAALKEEVQALQAQLKQKEQAHVSAQARLRAQLRTLEKDQRQYFDQIEELSKENKRFQMEAMKAGRENNNKMLQEINRNIARLAPKVSVLPNPVEVENTRRTKSFGGLESTTSNYHKAHKSTRQSVYGVVGDHNDKRHKHNRCRSKTRRKSIEQSLTSSSDLDEDFENHCDENDAQLLTAELKTPPKPSTKQKQTAPKPAETTASTKLANETANNTQNTSGGSAQDFKREIINPDGSKDIWYPNGNLKKISADGMTVRMLYFNKDIKETDIRAGTVKYYYAETNTWHTTYLDGLEILEFPNGQVEHRHKNGVIEIHFPNNTIKTVDPADELKLEEWRYADGTHLVQMRNGDKVLSLPNGQKEIHTKLNKRREYPDGTVKLVYPDGSQETRYSNGRVRLKDKDGKLIMDTDMSKY